MCVCEQKPECCTELFWDQDCVDLAAGCGAPCNVCGDDNRDPQELCDGSDLDGLTCDRIPTPDDSDIYRGGTLKCDPTSCTFDLSECSTTPVCGDGICHDFPFTPPNMRERCNNCPADCGACTGDCCAFNFTNLCGDADVSACVCALEPSCCDDRWDERCVRLAARHCELDCSGRDIALCGNSFCEPGEQSSCPQDCGGCCFDHMGFGCSAASFTSCVCEIRPECCSEGWDATCVGLARASCGNFCQGFAESCGDGVCDIPLGERVSCPEDCVPADAGATCGDGICEDFESCALCSDCCVGDCCTASDTPFCRDRTINTCVCAIDGSCCSDEWSQRCVDLAATHCNNVCPTIDCANPGDCQALVSGSVLADVDLAAGGELGYTFVVAEDNDVMQLSVGLDTGRAVMVVTAPDGKQTRRALSPTEPFQLLDYSVGGEWTVILVATSDTILDVRVATWSPGLGEDPPPQQTFDGDELYVLGTTDEILVAEIAAADSGEVTIVAIDDTGQETVISNCAQPSVLCDSVLQRIPPTSTSPGFVMIRFAEDGLYGIRTTAPTPMFRAGLLRPNPQIVVGDAPCTDTDGAALVPDTAFVAAAAAVAPPGAEIVVCPGEYVSAIPIELFGGATLRGVDDNGPDTPGGPTLRRPPMTGNGSQALNPVIVLAGGARPERCQQPHGVRRSRHHDRAGLRGQRHGRATPRGPWQHSGSAGHPRIGRSGADALPHWYPNERVFLQRHHPLEPARDRARCHRHQTGRPHRRSQCNPHRLGHRHGIGRRPHRNSHRHQR